MSKATFTISVEAGVTTVCVSRKYPARAGRTAERVWAIVSDFVGLKRIFPSLVRLYVTYPAASEALIGTVRDMSFATPDPGNPLAFGVEQLVEVDQKSRRLTYKSVLGLPVKNYVSVMAVSGHSACKLTWTSTYLDDGGGKNFARGLARILAGGADQIAAELAAQA